MRGRKLVDVLESWNDTARAFLKEWKLHRPKQLGHFSMHVTAVEWTCQPKPIPEEPMPEADHTPDLELASSSVRAKISVTDPRLPSGQKIVIAFSNWSTDDLTELPLEAAPDEDVTDADGNVVIDPEDGQPLKRYNVYANTPLAPVAPAKADGLVTCSYPGMTPCDKRVVYGDQPMGHFTMSGGEAPEVAAP